MPTKKTQSPPQSHPRDENARNAFDDVLANLLAMPPSPRKSSMRAQREIALKQISTEFATKVVGKSDKMNEKE